ncbi:AMP-binding protein [Streptomyces flavofungini]|uniref:AMP-binding protein n=1 Tax=Streptomyces flavofungini TaxID=68200 RepID=UPI0025B1BFC8|nr:AMP-binding protein [Streptomyces flavofungini]WJV47120.1 AMP-binding protein [Streptomyces flavofungini]
MDAGRQGEGAGMDTGAGAEIGFGAVAAAHPGRIALVEPDGTTLSYGELDARAGRLAHALAGLGLRPGDCVAAMLPNSRAFFELRLATGRSGLYFTPFSHHFTTAEVTHVVTDSEARVVVVDASLVEVAGPALDAAGIPAERRLVWGTRPPPPGWTDYEALLTTLPTTTPLPHPRAGGVMLYTSGTTGRPKAVRRALSDAPPGPSPYELDFMARVGVRAGAYTQLCAAPLYHAAPGLFANMAMQLGHTVVIAERPRTEEWLELIDRHRVDVLFAVPTVLHRALRLPAEVRGRYDVSSLSAVVHGAAPCPPEVKRRAIDWLGPVLYEFYAATEGGVSAADSADWLARPGTVGLPLASTEVRILDGDGRPVAAGETGGVYFRPAVPFAYHKDAQKTERSMRDGYFTAGDEGYVDEDGWLYLRDRRTDLIISGGVNVYPAEVEAVLIAHPDVADVAVVGLPDPEWGQRVAAVVQPEPGIRGDDAFADRLAAHCRGALAGFKVPRVIEFRERVPRSEAGKVLRREIRLDAAAGPTPGA